MNTWIFFTFLNYHIFSNVLPNKTLFTILFKNVFWMVKSLMLTDLSLSAWVEYLTVTINIVPVFPCSSFTMDLNSKVFYHAFPRKKIGNDHIFPTSTEGKWLEKMSFRRLPKSPAASACQRDGETKRKIVRREGGQ